jgi:hypothetical protein
MKGNTRGDVCDCCDGEGILYFELEDDDEGMKCPECNGTGWKSYQVHGERTE